MTDILARVRQRELTGSRAVLATLAGAAFTAVCAQVVFHLPGNPVPVTMQTFAVVACGLLLGGRFAAVAQIEYLLIGAAGAPVFAGFKGGWVALAGPTGGYLVGFVLAAFVVGSIAEKQSKPSLKAGCLAGMLGILALYVTGRAWLGVWLGDFSGLRSWALGVLPFVGVDAAKVLLASIVVKGRTR